jgi:transposase
MLLCSSGQRCAGRGGGFVEAHPAKDLVRQAAPERADGFALAVTGGAAVVVVTIEGHAQGLRWARQWPERTWALEDCRHLSRHSETDHLRAGEAVRRVPPNLMPAPAAVRGLGASPAPSTSSPWPTPPSASRISRRRSSTAPRATSGLLLDHRDDLVAERTRIQNRRRWHLHELEPGQQPPPRSLDRARVLDLLDSRLVALGTLVARIARQVVARCRELTVRVAALVREIAARASVAAPALLELAGCGALTAAKINGETAGIRRFRSRAAFAMHNGTVPVPVWSGNH